MYYLLSLFSGILIAISVFFNGRLSQTHSLHLSTVIIHIAGMILITAIILIKRDNPFSGIQKWYLYLGGAIGVFILICNNYAFNLIGVSAILALLLLGQSIAGLVIDQTGWLGMSKHPFHKHKIIGLVLLISGIAVMMIGRLDIIAALVSLLAGVLIVIARTLNAKLAENTSVRNSTFFNYFVGLSFSIPVYLIFSGNVGAQLTGFTFSPNVYIYFGGVLGMCFIMISNVIVSKIPAFYLSLSIFIAQVFTGIIIDTMIDGTFSLQILIGGIFVTAGLCIDLILDKRGNESERRQWRMK